jgi:hypothetical protein
MSFSMDSDHYKLSLDTSRAQILSKEELVGMKIQEVTQSNSRRDSFAGFTMKSGRGRQDVEPISTFGGGFSMKKAAEPKKDTPKVDDTL